jgi:1-acyl-sn-glycerol-3-phosphate acyltransferase
LSGRSWAKRVSYDLTRWAARLAGVGACQIRCSGREYIPADGPALVCSNHQSVLDPILVGLACDRRMNYLARRTLFRFAPFRWLIQWYDAIPIEREGMGLAGIKETLRRLRRGELVLIFPEGTRSPDGRLGPLKPGFCTLARRANAPLLPVAITGADRVWPRDRRWPQPAPVWVQFGPPILPEEWRELTDEQLVQRLESAIRQCQQQACYHGKPDVFSCES